MRLERRFADGIHVEWSPKTLQRAARRGAAGDRRCSSSPIASPTSTIASNGPSRCRSRRAASSPRSSPSCARAAAPGSRTAAARPTARRSTRDDRIRVPPADPAYTLRRVWLTEEEQDGYYYGFANEGLWPLCHIAFVRPTFREEDWAQYQAVNERFADAVAQEASRDDPIVLVQDYHFALLPRMVRERLPKRHHHHLLAHPLAERRDLRHLPVARGDHRRPARQHDPRLPHAVPLQQLPRDGRPLHGEPHRPRARLGHVRRPRDHDPAVSDLDRVAAGGACDAGPVPECREAVKQRFGSAGRCAHRRRHRAVRLHQGHSRPHPRRRRPAEPPSANGKASSSSSRPPRRRAASWPPTARCRPRPSDSPTRSMPDTATTTTSRSCSSSATTSRTRSSSCSAPPTCASSPACTTA